MLETGNGGKCGNVVLRRRNRETRNPANEGAASTVLTEVGQELCPGIGRGATCNERQCESEGAKVSVTPGGMITRSLPASSAGKP